MNIVLSTVACMLTSSFLLLGAATDEPELRPIQCQIEPMAPLEKHPFASYGFPWHRTHTIKRTVQGTSLNWSGFYAKSKKSVKHSVSHVSGTWTVPVITPATSHTYAYIWVGMDGASNHTIEQIGTGHKWGNGVQENIAWFQMYPHRSFRIKRFPIAPGDQISGEVRYVGDGLFSLQLKNWTQGVVFEVPQKFARSEHAHRSTADWMVSLPADHHTLLPLANFTTITFADCWTKIHGLKGAIGLTRWNNAPITMTATDGTTLKAQPSALTSGGTSFTVTWKSQ